MPSNPLDVGCLRLFDVTARHCNLTRAAAEVGLTQPALSYRIRRIEELLGTSLFRRRHRGLELTPEGEALHRAVRQGLEHLDEAVQSIRRRSRTPVVRLATDFAFATFRLMPLMAPFRRQHPDIDVHIVLTQSIAPGIESDVDLAILFGNRGDFEGEAMLLLPERVSTVCAPGVLRRFGPFERAEQLLKVPLIHLEGDSGARWFTWESWLAAAGVPDHASASSLSVNTYPHAIQAAQSEQGVALGWEGLVDDLLASGALVRAFGDCLGSDRGYWLLRQPVPTPEAGLVVQSIIEGFRSSRESPDL